MIQDQPYVVLLPKRPGNDTDKYLVVNVTEYVAVSLAEKKDYTFCWEYDNFDSAQIGRDKCNTTKETTPWQNSTVMTINLKTAVAGKPQEVTTTHPNTAISIPNQATSTAHIT